ncbi:hypothetical protein DPV78_008231 [Talaromyces pinophilus]|nr:hypothetical protein DPV78_008231 [Talaromyces pinophilus]
MFPRQKRHYENTSNARFHPSEPGPGIARGILLEQQSSEQEQARLCRQAAREEYEREHNKRQTDHESFLSRLAPGTADDAANIAREEDRKILLLE